MASYALAGRNKSTIDVLDVECLTARQGNEIGEALGAAGTVEIRFLLERSDGGGGKNGRRNAEGKEAESRDGAKCCRAWTEKCGHSSHSFEVCVCGLDRRVRSEIRRATRLVGVVARCSAWERAWEPAWK